MAKVHVRCLHTSRHFDRDFEAGKLYKVPAEDVAKYLKLQMQVHSSIVKVFEKAAPPNLSPPAESLPSVGGDGDETREKQPSEEKEPEDAESTSGEDPEGDSETETDNPVPE